MRAMLLSNPTVIWRLAALCLALACVVALLAIVQAQRLAARRARRLDAALATHAPTEEAAPAPERRRWHERVLALGSAGASSALGRGMVADEDRALLDRNGNDNERGRALFFLSRASLAAVLPVLLLLGSPWRAPMQLLLGCVGALTVGYMVPKWLLRRRAAQRRTRAADELPLLLDMLRLLQGVGLGLDQSLQVIVNDFRPILPVLTRELDIAAAQYRGGHSREASLQRFGSVFDNEDMKALTKLLAQIDRFGGAVQEPLRQFGERLREQRKLEMKARVGKLTVKMTAVMVTTLLPALLTITGGAGFLALYRGLAHITR